SKSAAVPARPRYKARVDAHRPPIRVLRNRKARKLRNGGRTSVHRAMPLPGRKTPKRARDPCTSPCRGGPALHRAEGDRDYFGFHVQGNPFPVQNILAALWLAAQ